MIFLLFGYSRQIRVESFLLLMSLIYSITTIEKSKKVCFIYILHMFSERSEVKLLIGHDELKSLKRLIYF